jgi:phage terminase large subunit
VQRVIPRKFQDLYRPGIRYKAYHGGRGSAKSHSVADYLVSSGVQRRMRFLCAREIQKSLATSVHQLLQDKIRDQGLQGAYHVTRDGIRGPHDTHFLFAGLRTNPDSVKSMEDLDGVWVEEADRCSQGSLDLLTPTMRNPKSELIFTWNRRSAKDPVDKLFLGGEPPPNSVVHQVNWRDNPFFPKVLWDEMMWLKRRDPDKWRHVWEGEPLQLSEARVFHNWRVDDVDDQVPDDAWLAPRLGADWGFSVDPTVLVECYAFGRTLYFRRERWKVGCEIDETPALFAGDCPHGADHPYHWTNRHAHRGLESVRAGHRIVADSARPETISYMKNRGFDIVKARKGPGSVEDGVEFMKSYDIVVHPECRHIEDEMATYSYKLAPITDEVLPILADKKNHTVDAARYALESVRRAMSGDGSYFGGECIESEL